MVWRATTLIEYATRKVRSKILSDFKFYLQLSLISRLWHFQDQLVYLMKTQDLLQQTTEYHFKESKEILLIFGALFLMHEVLHHWTLHCKIKALICDFKTKITMDAGTNRGTNTAAALYTSSKSGVQAYRYLFFYLFSMWSHSDKQFKYG